MSERLRVVRNPNTSSSKPGPIEITRTETSEPLDAPAVWADLLYRKHPEISDITLAYYECRRLPVGAVGQEDSFHRVKTNYLRSCGYFTDIDYPKIYPNSQSSLCAISCIVGTSKSSGKTTMLNSHKKLEFALPNPKSFIHIDLATRSFPTPGILARTLHRLQELPYDWYVLSTGLSYHIIIDHLFDIENFPWYWGEVLEHLARFSSSEYERRRGLKYSGLLKIASGDLNLLLKLKRIMKHDIGGYYYGDSDSDENGRRTSPGHDIDWGHVYLSFRDFVSFCQGNSDGAGYLRISSKNQYSPPFLVAQKEGGQITQFIVQEPYYSSHIDSRYTHRIAKDPEATSLWNLVELELALDISGADESTTILFLQALEYMDGFDRYYLLTSGPLGIESVLSRRMGIPIDSTIIRFAEKLHEALKML
jgi:hypothetical protein